MSEIRTDILIVGAGLAGLFLALRLAPRRCVVLSPGPLGYAASSAWAQGGIAAALGRYDSPAQHAKDTELAGAGLVDPKIAAVLADEAATHIQTLIELGVPFDRDPSGQLALGLEAAHSQARIVHVTGDLAGKAIMGSLAAAVRTAAHIRLLEGVRAVSLLSDGTRVSGALTRGADGEGMIRAAETVLATGGVGGLFRVTTNPKEARGVALAHAARAGAVLADAEFVQFHPTAIDIGADPAPLATEALRGEGARLVDAQGQPLMARYHPAGDLAPRDIVARAIHAEREAGREVWLDCREGVGERFAERFPTVFGACMAAGIDPRLQPIPVAPAAHYHMGGVAVDAWGRSTVEGLSACGECSSTGAHGANRLASNSLLEALVYGERIATRLRDESLTIRARGEAIRPPLLESAILTELRERMTRACGVVRDAQGLQGLLHWLEDAEHQSGGATAILAARIVVTAALARRESRGGHYRADYPQEGAIAARSFFSLSAEGVLQPTVNPFANPDSSGAHHEHSLTA